MKRKFMIPVGVAAMALASSANATISQIDSNIKEKKCNS